MFNGNRCTIILGQGNSSEVVMILNVISVVCPCAFVTICAWENQVSIFVAKEMKQDLVKISTTILYTKEIHYQ